MPQGNEYYAKRALRLAESPVNNPTEYFNEARTIAFPVQKRNLAENNRNYLGELKECEESGEMGLAKSVMRDLAKDLGINSFK